MPMFTAQREIFSRGGESSESSTTITVGIVVDTNDPQQMGRVRAVCTQWGDSMNAYVEDLPWALYCTPFGGQTSVGTRGPGIQTSEGGIAYGMWAIPKVGAQVLVMCVDGDPNHRVYLGCVFDQFTPHTLPHGRFMYDDHPELEKRNGNMRPFGPYTSREKAIQPLFDNLKYAFGNKDEPNYEWRTRAADVSVAGVSVDQLNHVYSKVADDRDFSYDDWMSTQGYQLNRIDPTATSATGKNLDSSVYSITSPGFHSISMDDRQENCRVRVRTTSGHQILLDDTNERIYIATAKGNNWIEMDQDGNIDIFTTNKLNIHANKDINLTSDESIRLQASKGIHMVAGDEIRMQAAADIHVKSAANIRLQAAASVFNQAGSEYNVLSGSDMKLTTSTQLNLLAGGNIVENGAQIHLNGQPSAASAKPANPKPAMWTNRVPDHEPWARVMTKSDYTHEPEYVYNNKNVNRVERGRNIVRGMYWRR